MTETRAVGFSIAEMIAGGFSIGDMRLEGFSAAEMKEGGCSCDQMKRIGYLPGEMKSAGFTSSEMRAARFKVQQMVEGCSVPLAKGSVYDPCRVLSQHYAVVYPGGAPVRAGIELSTPIIGSLHESALVGVRRIVLNSQGIPRVRLADRSGWSSLVDTDGVPIMAEGGVAGRGTLVQNCAKEATRLQKSRQPVSPSPSCERLATRRHSFERRVILRWRCERVATLRVIYWLEAMRALKCIPRAFVPKNCAPSASTVQSCRPMDSMQHNCARRGYLAKR